MSEPKPKSAFSDDEDEKTEGNKRDPEDEEEEEEEEEEEALDESGEESEEEDEEEEEVDDKKRKRSDEGSKKAKKARLFDEEAELSGEESDEDEEEDEDRDAYEEDDFLVGDDDLDRREKRRKGKDKSKDKDAQSSKESKKKLKKKLKRSTLDEDDLLLIQENQRRELKTHSLQTLDVDSDEERVSKKPSKAPHAREDEGEEEGEGDEEMESDVDDFIEQDEDEEDQDVDYRMDAERERVVPRGRRYVSAEEKAAQQAHARTAGTASTDKIKEAMEIFGEEFVLDVDDDFYEDEERELQRRAQEQKDALLSGNKSAFEYMEMVESFLLPQDKLIVEKDVPERFQQYFTEGEDRFFRWRETEKAFNETQDDSMMENSTQDIFNTQSSFVAHSSSSSRALAKRRTGAGAAEGERKSAISEQERLEEARWIAQLLQRTTPSLSQSLSLEQLVSSVVSVLQQMQEEHLEVPFLWLYRRDTFHSSLTRALLWQCFTLDMRWCRFQYEIGVTMRLIELLEQALSETYTVEEAARVVHVKYCSDLLESAQDEDAVRDIRRFVVLNLSVVHKEQERRKIEERKNKAKSKGKKSGSNSNAENGENEYFKEEKDEEKDLFDDDDDDDDYSPFKSSSKSRKDKDEDRESDREEEEGEEEKKTNADRGEEPIKSSVRNNYLRFKTMPKIREFISLFTVPVWELGSATRYGYDVDQPRTSELSTTDTAKALFGIKESEQGRGSNEEKKEQSKEKEKEGEIFKKVEPVMRAVRLVVATEIAAEPSLRERAREIYRENASISTTPTATGLHAITPFSMYFGLHFLAKKPLREFLSSREGLLQFMKILDAEQQGFINIKFNRPENENPFIMLFSKFTMHDDPREDDFPQSRLSWDFLRMDILTCVLKEHLFPSLEKEMRSDLTRLGKDAVIEECASNFEQLLRVGPFMPPIADQRKEDCERALAALAEEHIPSPWRREDCERVYLLLKETPKRAKPKSVAAFYLSQEGKNSGLHMVMVDAEGDVKAYREIPSQAMSSKKEKIETFLYDTRPELILLNGAAGVVARTLEQLITLDVVKSINDTIRLQLENRKDASDRMQYDDEEPEEEVDYSYQPSVLIVDDTLAANFKSSRRAKIFLPALPAPACAAVSLCRFALEPLAEYANMWRTADANGVFGFEATFLSLHPLQKHVERFTAKFVRALEFKLVDAVADAGVDIRLCLRHEHYASLLAFVPGLGVRKAHALRNAIVARQTSAEEDFVLDRREALMAQPFLRECVYRNAAGFVRIFPFTEQTDRDWHPLDNTRIHPYAYIENDFAQQICSSALELENDPGRAVQHIHQLMQRVKKEFSKRVSRHPELLFNWMPSKPDVSMSVQSNGYMMTVADKALLDMLSSLDMGDFNQTLQQAGHGSNPLLMEMIKEELRFPFLDLRRPLAPISAKRFFEIVTGENDFSLYVGRPIGFTVLRHLDGSGPGGDPNRFQHPGDMFPHTALVSTDIPGIRGRISKFEVLDDDHVPRDFDITQYLPVGAQGVAVVVGIKHDRMSLQLSVKPRYLTAGETWWLRNRSADRHMAEFLKERDIDADRMFDIKFQLEEALNALDDLEKRRETALGKARLASAAAMVAAGGGNNMPKTAGSFSRIIVHPLFANVDAAGAQDRLNKLENSTGAVLFRPSSSGWDQLTLTWVFQPGIFKHIRIKEKDKRPGEMKIGDKLYIEEDDMQDDRFHDIDDIHANFVEHLNSLVERMKNYSKFKSGSPQEVEAYMFDFTRKNPGLIPYVVRLEPGKPRFVWTWLVLRPDGQHIVKKMNVDVHFKGYKIMNKYFETPQMIANWFKTTCQQSLERSQDKRLRIAELNSGELFSAAPPPQARVSRFSDAKPAMSYAQPSSSSMGHYGPPPSAPVHGHYGPQGGNMYVVPPPVPPPPPARR